jgi:hypothetical protein
MHHHRGGTKVTPYRNPTYPTSPTLASSPPLQPKKMSTRTLSGTSHGSVLCLTGTSHISRDCLTSHGDIMCLTRTSTMPSPFPDGFPPQHLPPPSTTVPLSTHVQKYRRKKTNNNQYLKSQLKLHCQKYVNNLFVVGIGSHSIAFRQILSDQVWKKDCHLYCRNYLYPVP